ncbi:CK1 family protein kinase [Histomonas meleagridis]|uniref:CK1 family protein kinase n=1 Tax=Histomonas meleagridis TaxID=135588 RepID=UPI00355A8734|nr:CK1 family protein kinase [Histomonas meleagridis]KAH0799663.1 CK1 family protein kinase [Histomonas meleagridis]
MDEKDKNVYPPNTQINQFIIYRHIGHGGYGEIYSVYTTRGKGPYAMKVERKDAKKHGLLEEIKFVKKLSETPLFPRFYLSGETNEINYYIMELLGPSLSAIRRVLPSKVMSKATATILAKEMLSCIEELHFRGFIHRDIKPGNFLIRPNRKNPICLIDFGLSKRYLNKNGQQLKQKDHPGFVGTCSFASVYAHDGEDLSRRDDLISWIYCIVELVQKHLPWPGSKDREETYSLKKSIHPEDLCKNLPDQFIKIYTDVAQLGFYDKPNYRRYFKLLNTAIEELGGAEQKFDWESLPKETISRISPVSLDMTSFDYSYSGYEEEEEEYETEYSSASTKNETPVKKKEETQPVKRVTIVVGQEMEKPRQKTPIEISSLTREVDEKEVGCKCNIY